jgi:hypothetical protein
MIEPPDFISDNEGRETPRPFFTRAVPCESCGKPVDSRIPASWDPDLLVGPCCEIHADDLPQERPVCETLYQSVCRAQTVQQVRDAFNQHQATGCPLCCPTIQHCLIDDAPQVRKAA